MPKFLISIGQFFRGCMSILLIVVLTIFWTTPMYLLLILKVLSPHPKFLAVVNYLLLRASDKWIQSNNLVMDLMLNINWDLPDFSHLEYKQWYFIICNHQSWTDILILQRIFLKKIPFIRFFIKKELMFLPVLNGAWWAYDFPIMHRHTKEQIAKNPKLRTKDLQATKKACEKYKLFPVTILNFLEGTRFTKTKHHKQQSPFHHLLVPKLGGFAYAVNAMDKKITHILDVTIIYPEGRKSFWDFLCGRVRHISVKLQIRDIPPNLLQGNYTEDESYRNNFKNWIHTIWHEKDTLLNQSLK